MSANRAIVPAGGQPSFQVLSGQVPYSQEAEEACIGAVLVNPAAFAFVAAFLMPEDFYFLRHIYIWEALSRMHERDAVIDYLTVQEELRGMGRLNEIGGPAYLIQLTNNTPTSMHAEVYGRLVERAAIRRRLLNAADKIKALAMDMENNDADSIIVDSHQAIEGVRSRQDKLNFVAGITSIQEYDEILSQIEERVKAGKAVSFPTPEPWGVLHEAVPVTFPGDFMVVSGPSGSGKSALCECWAEDLADQGVNVFYIHTEMSSADILHRRMSRHSGLPFDVLKSHGFRPGKVNVMGNWEPGDYARIVAADQEISKFAPNLNYLHLPDPDFKKLTYLMRQAVLAGAQAIFLDHFQDVRIPIARGQNPIMAYETAISWLSGFAETREVHLVVASQETNGHVKWSRKLVEKAVLWISINRPKLKQEIGYWLNGIEYRSLIGEYTPFPDVFVQKARFGKTGKRPGFYHGPQFKWMDRRDVQTQKAAGKVIAFGQIPLNTAAEV